MQKCHNNSAGVIEDTRLRLTSLEDSVSQCLSTFFLPHVGSRTSAVHGFDELPAHTLVAISIAVLVAKLDVHVSLAVSIHVCPTAAIDH